MAVAKSTVVDHSNRYPEAPSTGFHDNQTRPMPGLTAREGPLVEAESANGLAQATTRQAPRARGTKRRKNAVFMVSRLMVPQPKVKARFAPGGAPAP